MITRKSDCFMKGLRCISTILLMAGVVHHVFSQKARRLVPVTEQIVVVTDTVHGTSMAEWGIRWTDYLFSFNCDKFPVFSATGEGADQFQEGPVYFLSGAVGGIIRRQVTVESGKYLFIPIVTYLNHYPCPYPNFKPAPGQSMKAFLIEGAADIIDGVNTMKLAINGDTLSDLSAYRFTSDLFYLKANPELVCIDVCITDGPQPSIIDGYWVLIKPLPKGRHEIWFYGEVPGHGMVVDVGYEVSIY